MGEKIIDPVLRKFFDSLKVKDTKPVTKPVETKEKTLHKDEPVKVPKQHDKLLEERRAEFKKYKSDKNYIEEETQYDPKTGALMATHKEHIVHTEGEELFFGNMTSTMLEKECQKELYRLGHKAILEKELDYGKDGNVLACLDMTFDKERVDIASITQNGY